MTLDLLKNCVRDPHEAPDFGPLADSLADRDSPVAEFAHLAYIGKNHHRLPAAYRAFWKSVMHVANTPHYANVKVNGRTVIWLRRRLYQSFRSYSNPGPLFRYADMDVTHFDAVAGMLAYSRLLGRGFRVSIEDVAEEPQQWKISSPRAKLLTLLAMRRVHAQVPPQFAWTYDVTDHFRQTDIGRLSAVSNALLEKGRIRAN